MTSRSLSWRKPTKIALEYHARKSHGIERFFVALQTFDTMIGVNPVYGIDPNPPERSVRYHAQTHPKTLLAFD